MERLIEGDFVVLLVPSMSSTEMKRKREREEKKPSSTPQSNQNPSLPDDLVLSIIARVPRLYYPTLSLVSKSFRSLLTSPELYQVRSLLGNTENCLYVCLGLYPNCRWYTLCRKPDQTLINDTNEKKKSSSGYVLASVPIPNSPIASLVAVGSEIYNIGAPKAIRTSGVSILNCWSHTWREAPSLPVELFNVSLSVFDGKIYAAGVCKDVGSRSGYKNSVQVFDPETQAWDPELISYTRTFRMFYPNSACIDGKLLLATPSKGLVYAYNFNIGSWDTSLQLMFDPMGVDYSYCLIDNVLYSASPEAFRWYNTNDRRWRILQGLVGLPKFPHDACVRLANYGGKLAVLWETFPYSSHLKMIWCAEISLERRKSCVERRIRRTNGVERPLRKCTRREIWGKVEWFDQVLAVNKLSSLVNVLVATV